ncbi:hypothetical protein JTE90_012586 [Oedothorax gibbosus]|uniref:Uncharacterized protein n=1 Tax=Oedothorax gibbosus TaxID=931172 RepID=A0AAV6V2G7_9ARAC|nr:hypothetical protein JTE90_012586 [Oedothorax gibbosus]
MPQQFEINLKDDQANEITSQIQEILQLIEEIIQQVEHELDHPINKDQSSGIQSSTECFSNPKPLKSLEKATENLEPSDRLPPADPPRGLEEIKHSQTTATENRLETMSSPVPKKTPKPWPEELEPLKDNYSYKGRLGKGDLAKCTNFEINRPAKEWQQKSYHPIKSRLQKLTFGRSCTTQNYYNSLNSIHLANTIYS